MAFLYIKNFIFVDYFPHDLQDKTNYKKSIIVSGGIFIPRFPVPNFIIDENKVFVNSPVFLLFC